MAVEVVVEGGETDIFKSANKWHIDEHRILHVVGPQGNVAAYATGTWVIARSVEIGDADA